MQKGAEPEIHTLLLKGGLERFVEMLWSSDEFAVEATGNSRWFHEQVPDHVARVVVVAPWRFEVIRRSTDKTDKNDAKALALFISKDILPESRVKSKVQAQLATAIRPRDQGTKQRVQLINTVYAMFHVRGVKIKKQSLVSKVGFERAVNSCEWSEVERGMLQAIAVRSKAMALRSMILLILSGLEASGMEKNRSVMSARYPLTRTSWRCSLSRIAFWAVDPCPQLSGMSSGGFCPIASPASLRKTKPR